MSASSPPVPDLPHVVLKPRRALPFFNRHPWVFEGAIQQIDKGAASGDEVALVSHDQQFIGRGLLNRESNICVRMYNWDRATPLDEAFWSSRLDRAIALRRELYGPRTDRSACRLVYSEADGLSGLIVDEYGEWLLVQLGSLALLRRRDLLISLLQEKVGPRGMLVRMEKEIREAEGLEAEDALVHGAEPPRPLVIEEQGLEFGVDIAHGQKTGFFLDQRHNREAVARHCQGRRVLDLFCYTGGFGISALRRGGAQSVLAVDLSEPALAMGRANAERNGVADRIEWLKSDSFKALERLREAGEQFDVVVLDPPKLVRNRKSLESGLRGYFSLNRLALDVLRPGGLLVTCSCSGHVSREMFADVLATVAVKADRSIQILEMRGQSPDHPLSVQCLESDYLKCFLCRVV